MTPATMAMACWKPIRIATRMGTGSWSPKKIGEGAVGRHGR